MILPDHPPIASATVPSEDAAGLSLRLVDPHGRPHTYLRLSVTDRCNLRCTYCMPPEGITWRERAEILTFEEIERLAAIFVRGGVDKIRLTGGEPTVRRELPALIARLRRLPGLRTLLMTTNGVLLAQQAAELRHAGLDGLNISLDSLRRDRFERVTLRDNLPAVLAGIDAALAAGFATVKLNVVVIQGTNDDELVDFVRFAAGRPLQVRFIEFMPFDRNGWSAGGLLPYATMRERIESVFTLEPLAAGPHAVAKDFAIAGGVGTVGFVTSMTEHFCAGCNRLRLTADGRMRNCLFATAETDLRGPLRAGAGDAELAAHMQRCLQGKWREHPPAAELAELHNRSMIEIGG
jgi:cyclic pyranopterin phosphate synthase